MAVTTSGSGKESTPVRVTGVLKVKEVLINPTKEELEKYGIGWKSPEYELNDPDRGRGQIIDFYFKADESQFSEKVFPVALNVRFYLFNTVKKSQGGKIQYINAFGNTAYADDEQSLPAFFEKEGVRPALEGEEGIIKFIKAWGDWRKGDECSLDTIKDITKGKIRELKELEALWASHKLKVLVALTDTGGGKFQHVVYNKEFWRVYANSVYLPDSKTTEDFETGIPKLIKSQFGEFKKADVVTVEPTVWTEAKLKEGAPKLLVPDPDPDEDGSYDYQEGDLPFDMPEDADQEVASPKLNPF